MNYLDLNLKGNIYVFLDVSIDDIKCGRVVLELFKNHVPKTVENFRALCTGEKGIGTLNCPLHYKNTIFHKATTRETLIAVNLLNHVGITRYKVRAVWWVVHFLPPKEMGLCLEFEQRNEVVHCHAAVPECIVQGGDISNHDGTGGESIYGPYFEDENLDISHLQAGLLSMANCGLRDSNNSQFCVTLGQATHLDRVHVVFGRVVKGFNIINSISYQPLQANDAPIPVCKIWDCGELQPGEDWGYCCRDWNDVYPPFPQDWEPPHHIIPQVNEMVNVVTNIKDAGNQLLKRGDSRNAHQKYKKALRYLDWYTHMRVGDRDQLSSVRAQCRLNAALACVKLSYFREAVQHCNEVSDIQSNAKALFRRAMAYDGLNEHEKALMDLGAALKLAPHDSAVLAEMSRIKHVLRSYQQDERRRWGSMFKA